uniref:RNA-directed DNA polymerase n=1 Tax=Candidatus Kentrum sp. TC TaxID=2126339 RepID=A0A450ZB33_9GAMM|nr:MAG: RNA-directed DNA polymerase [Candidatus Kentron sp. TC]
MRYANDFVVMCRNYTQAEETLALVQLPLGDELGLKLSSEKTHIATFSEGFAYLGFDLCSRSVTMRAKSVENLEAKVREITEPSHNLDDEVIDKLNQVVRGTANYFATAFSHNRSLFRSLDRWIRMRLRCIGFKRKWTSDNRRLRSRSFLRMGFLSSTCVSQNTQLPERGTPNGVARCPKRARR